MCLQATESACLQQRNKTAYVGGRRTRSTVQMLRRVHASHLSPVLRQPRVSLAHPRPPTSRPPPLLVTCRQNSQLLLSFSGGSNHRPEFDERCLHRVTAHVHGQSLSGRTRPSQDKRLTVPEVESNPMSSLLTANPHYQTTGYCNPSPIRDHGPNKACRRHQLIFLSLPALGLSPHGQPRCKPGD